MSALVDAVRRAASRCALVLAVVTGAIAGQALWAPGLVQAEWCGPTMPQKVNFARGYMSTGVLEATEPEERPGPPSWEFMVEKNYAGEPSRSACPWSLQVPVQGQGGPIARHGRAPTGARRAGRPAGRPREPGPRPSRPPRRAPGARRRSAPRQARPPVPPGSVGPRADGHYK